MASRLFRRRATTALGVYSSVLLGFLGTLVAARVLGARDFGLFAIVLAATAFFQTLLDLTVEEAVTKYGFRYTTTEDWGRLRRLFARAALFKGAGALLAGLGLVVLAPLAERAFGVEGLAAPLLVAALIPVAQAPEGLAGTAIILHGRYDVRGAFLGLSMALRLTGIAVGAPHGIVWAVAGMAAAQVLATAAITAAGVAAFRRFPRAPTRELGADGRGIRSFVLQSTAATGVVSLRTALAPLLLGAVSMPTQVGFFRVALSPQQAIHTLSAPVRMILLTEQTRDWELGAHERVFAGVRRFSVGTALLVPLAAVPLFVWMDDALRVVFGAEYLGAADAARIVLAAGAIQFVFGWTKSLPVTIGRPNLRVQTHGLETLVMLPLTGVLGARWGAAGAAGALLAATAVFASHWTFLLLRIRRRTDVPPLPREAVAP